jgi:ubiquinone/menaquinone biosynthesis C-methylase UbiE
VLREMKRVVKPTGRILVTDMYSSSDPKKANAFNSLEKLRDPSHVRALPLTELKDLFVQAGLCEPRAEYYSLRDEVRNLLARSFPETPEDVAEFIRRMRKSAEDDGLGIDVKLDGELVNYAYPVVVLSVAV